MFQIDLNGVNVQLHNAFAFICTATVQFVCIHMWICVGVGCRKKGLRQVLYHIQQHENSECRAPSVLIHVVAPNK